MAEATLRSLGLREGERHRVAIRELVRRRLGLLREAGGDGAVAKLDGVLERLQASAPELGELLGGWAEAADLPPAELLSLDGGLLETWIGGGRERSLGLYIDGPRGPVLGGAWALAPEEAEQVGLRASAEASERRRGPWILGLPGSFGLAGISATGFAAQSNLLRPATAGPGLPGSAQLRRLLACDRLAGARSAIESTALIDGRCWMLADGRAFLGFEQLGDERILTRVGPKTGHVHANHCFDPSLRQREARPRSPASFRRLELASTIYVQTRPSTAEDMLSFFDEVEAAAFEPGERAETLWAVELREGRAWLRRRLGEAPERVDFYTPLTTEVSRHD